MPRKRAPRSSGADPAARAGALSAGAAGTDAVAAAPRRTSRQGPGEKSTGPVGDAREAALAMLARRSQPAAKLREKLLRKFPADDVEPVIARFVELGLLDDGAYAQTFVRDRFLRAGYGRERIRNDLLRKGVSRTDVEAAIDAVVDASTERAQAERALQRFRARRTRVDDPRKLREAAFRHLVGRGFALSLVRELLDVS